MIYNFYFHTCLHHLSHKRHFLKTESRQTFKEIAEVRITVKYQQCYYIYVYHSFTIYLEVKRSFYKNIIVRD